MTNKEKAEPQEVIKLHEMPLHSKIYCKLSDGSKYLVFEHHLMTHSLYVTEMGNFGMGHVDQDMSLIKYKDGYKINNEHET